MAEVPIPLFPVLQVKLPWFAAADALLVGATDALQGEALVVDAAALLGADLLAFDMWEKLRPHARMLE